MRIPYIIISRNAFYIKRRIFYLTNVISGAYNSRQIAWQKEATMKNKFETREDQIRNQDDKKGDFFELFVQGEGLHDIQIMTISSHSKISDIIAAADTQKFQNKEDKSSLIFIENEDDPLDASSTLKSNGIKHHGRIHIHRCRKIVVTVNFNGSQRSKDFPPSVTINRVQSWAVSKKAFDLSDIDATEHALQICGSATRPDIELHLGDFVAFPDCAICFDLVPKKRVEG